MLNCLNGVSIKAISCAVPKDCISIHQYANDVLTEKSAKKMTKVTGFSSLRISNKDMTTADLCMAAAEPLFRDYSKKDIGAIVLVTQTPDYILPATSHILQHKLALSEDTLCIDINEGCSGYVTGIYTGALLAKQLNKNVCLFVGDTLSKITSPLDRATRCVFGDAGTATIISPGGGDVPFIFKSYGARYKSIIVENSLFRNVNNPQNDGYIYMDGVGIMNFGLNEVPAIINELLNNTCLSVENISLFICHQANKMIISSLAEILKVDSPKIPFTASNVGNESSASIPMVLSASQDNDLSKVMCCGFGVGLSAGAFIYDFRGTKFYGVSEL